MSSDHHELSPAEAGRYARDVREAIDRVLAEVRASLDSTVRQLATTIAADVRASDQRFSEAMRRMDDASSLRGVLHELMESVAREADRSVLLIASQGRLKGRSSSGFAGSSADPRAVDLPSDPGGLLGAAMHAKSMIVSLASAPFTSASERPQFALGPGSRDAIAVPLVLGGTVGAVVYADAPAAADAPSWPGAVDRLARYAALLLETRTARYLTSVDADASVTVFSGIGRGKPGGAR